MEGCLKLETVPVRTDLADGEVMVRTILLSLDPTQRIWMTDQPQYMPPVALGEVMRSLVIGRVVDSKNSSYASGSYVHGIYGMQEVFVGRPAEGSLSAIPFQLPSKVPLNFYFGLLGLVGATAYHGLLDVGKMKAGDVVVVSGAAGAVGSLVGQIAKIHGAKKVIGIAGSKDKCDWLVEEAGFDAAINYNTHSGRALSRAICEAAGVRGTGDDGVNVYFDNVGGDISDAIYQVMQNFGHVSVCGLISGYQSQEPPAMRAFGTILMRRLTVAGFIASDYASRWSEAFADLNAAYVAGKIKYRVDERDGFEKIPAHLCSLFDGSNTGKLIVRISEDNISKL